MATTSPDNIKTPDAGDQYALVQDMGALADTVQSALVRRANLYKGTTAQRNAFTAAPEGTWWQDTNGTKDTWVRKAGAWENLNPDTGWVNIPFTGWTHQATPQARVYRGVVYFRGLLSNNSFTGGFTAVGNLPGSIPPPGGAYRSVETSIATTVRSALRVHPSGLMEVSRDGTSGTWIDISRMSYPVG